MRGSRRCRHYTAVLDILTALILRLLGAACIDARALTIPVRGIPERLLGATCIQTCVVNVSPYRIDASLSMKLSTSAIPQPSHKYCG